MENDSKQILFVLNHWGGFSNMMMLRTTIHAHDEAIILVPEYIKRDFVLNKMVKNGLISAVITFDDRLFFKSTTTELLLDGILRYYDTLLYDNNLCLQNISDIYIVCDMTNTFGIYLLEKRKVFTIYEIVRNATLLRTRYDGGFKDGWIGEPYYKYQKEKGLLCGEKGNCNIIIHSNSDVKKIIKELPKCTIIDFDDYSIYNKETIDRILSCFDTDLSCLDSEVQLVILNSQDMCNGHSLYTRNQSIYAFQLLLEYFGKTKLKRVIKPHPSDTVEELKDYFLESTFIDADFPIEYIRLQKNVQISELLSISSSGADKILSLVNKYTETGWIFYKIVPFLTRLDICYRLITDYTDYTLINQDVTTNWKDLEQAITKLFFEKNQYKTLSLKNENSSVPTCYIRNELSDMVLENLNKDCLLLFFKYEVLPEMNLNNIVSIRIDYYPVKNSYFNHYVQWIYGYTLNSNIIKKLEHASIRLSLKETMQEVSIQGFSILSTYILPVKYVEIIMQNIGNRDLIFWGIGGQMENELYSMSGLKLSGRVFWNQTSIKNKTDHHFSWIDDKKEKIYLVCWNIKKDSKLYSYFDKNGYKENIDYLLIVDKHSHEEPPTG